MFTGGGEDADMPTTELTEDEAGGEVTILDLITRCGLAKSRAEARRLIEQGGISVNRERVSTADAAFSSKEIAAGIIIKKGKKTFHKIILK